MSMSIIHRVIKKVTVNHAGKNQARLVCMYVRQKLIIFFDTIASQNVADENSRLVPTI